MNFMRRETPLSLLLTKKILLVMHIALSVFVTGLWKAMLTLRIGFCLKFTLNFYFFADKGSQYETGRFWL